MIRLWGQGDEFSAVFETPEGYRVIFDQGLRAYCYARLSATGDELLSTGVLVQASNPAGLGLSPHLRITPGALRRQIAERYASWDAALEVSKRWQELKAAGARAAAYGPAGIQPVGPTTGTKVGLTLLIDFSDDTATIPQAEILSFCNGDKYSNYSNNGSVKKYYQDVSNGKLTYSNVVTIYIRAPQPKTYYNDVSQDSGPLARMLIGDAVAAMKALPNYTTTILPLFDPVTADAQNRVVAFNIFFAGDNSGVWSMGLWPHSWNLGTSVELSPGGKRLYRYQISNVGDALEIGTFCHENGHMLCGFPDLYDYTYDSCGAGDFCLMASGSWGGNGHNPTQICAYLKRLSGWATTTDLTGDSGLIATVSAAGADFNHFYRYVNPNASTEYYLIENRFQAGHDGALPGSGLVVWHIDELGDNSTVNLSPNTTHDNYEATVVQADNRWDLERNRNSGDANDFFFNGNPASGYVNQLNDTTGPSTHWWDSSVSGLMLRLFSAKASTMTVVVGPGDPAPAGLVLQPAKQTIRAGNQATFSLTVGGGYPPFSYQWLKDGETIPGATSSAYSIAKAQLTDSGAYSVIVTNSFGSAASIEVSLLVVPSITLAEALNTTNLAWSTDSPFFWYGQYTIAFDNHAAAQSYNIADNQQTGFRTTVIGPGTLSFWWRVSSETNSDFLSLSYGGMVQAQISGEADWQAQTHYLGAGTNTLAWTYTKDASGNAGADAGWVDMVSYTPGGSAPRLAAQPAGQSVSPGTRVVFSAVADGTPPLQCQWLFNGQNIPNATNSTLVLSSAVFSDGGLYALAVSNGYGFVLSDNATLTIVPAAATGNNSFSQSTIPLSATSTVAIAAGNFHSLALRRDGTVAAWGDPWNGQCNVPSDLTGVIAIAAGGFHSLALKWDGTVAAWGANDSGQATPPSGLTNIIAIAAGEVHSLAARADGRVIGWGDNSYGQTSVPAGLSNVVAIAAGGSHSLALRRDGTVVSWGRNTDANGFYTGQAKVPPGLTNIVALAAGAYHSLAVRGNGTVVCWGDNSQNQSRPPAGLTNVVAVAGGDRHSLAVSAEGRVTAWGNDWSGQCDFPPTLTNVVAVAAGNSFSLALTADPAPPLLQYPVWASGQFRLVVQTLPGRNYALECGDLAPAPHWATLQSVRGNGTGQFLVDPCANRAQRYYRVRQW